MRRRRGHDGAKISLFPFLSILVCVVGTLTLLLAGTVLGRVAQTDQTMLEQFLALEREREDSEKERGSLRELIADAVDLARSLEEAREELARLEALERDARAQEGAAVEALQQIHDTKRKLQELRQRLVGLGPEIEHLDQQLESARAAREEARSRIVLHGHGSGTGLAPWFAECTRDGVTLHPDRETRILVRVGECANDARLMAFLREVKSRSDRSAVFLIRPGGVRVFDEALSVVLKEKVRHGFAPVPGDRAIDFRMFSRHSTAK